MVLDAHLTVVAANEPFNRLVGPTAAGAVGQSLAALDGGRWNDPKLIDLLKETTPDEVELETVASGGEGRSAGLKYRMKARQLDLDGTGDPLIFVTLGALHGGAGLAGSGRQMQWAELDHAFRSRVVDQIIAALSHELAQPLSAITGFTHASLRAMKGLDEVPLPLRATIDRMIEALELVAGEAERAGTIIRRVRGFARRQAPPQSLLDVNELVRELIAFVADEAALHRIEVKAELDPALPPIRADAVGLSQVVVSLLRNAIEAIDAAGATERRIVVQSHDRREDGTVEIAVIDTGPGLPAELADRAFAPFVSAKPEGLGLGLTLSRAVLQAHGGRLWIDGEGSRPTTFRFALPAVPQVETDDH